MTLKLRLFPIWTKPKFKFLLFCWIWDISNFKSARPNVNSLTFWKNAFFTENYFPKCIFFCEWGASASALARARQGPHPHSLKKFVMKRFSMKKNFFVKSQGIYLESSWFEIQNVSNSANKQKNKFWFCSNWEQVQL